MPTLPCVRVSGRRCTASDRVSRLRTWPWLAGPREPWSREGDAGPVRGSRVPGEDSVWGLGCFGLCPQHTEVPGPGPEPVPQPGELQDWVHLPEFSSGARTRDLVWGGSCGFRCVWCWEFSCQAAPTGHPRRQGGAVWRWWRHRPHPALLQSSCSGGVFTFRSL